jgi:transposase InsO family protein
VSANQATYPIATMCRLLGVSLSGYYAWTKRAPSQRAQADAVLLSHIRAAHAASHGTYGAPRIHVELRENGIRVGRKRVARLMAAAGLCGVSRRRFLRTTVRGAGWQAPDLVDRNFTADKPNLLWVADITYIGTGTGFLYLAVVLDACSRRIVGWAMSTRLVTQLVLDALDMALATRHPDGVIHHSDQGSQYTSIEFGQRCRVAGVRPSMGSVGDAYDNAMCESFFATLECELLDRQRFKSQAEARRRCSPSLKRFTIGDAATLPSAISRRLITNNGLRFIPTRQSLPACSRPSRTSPAGDRRSSLTAAPRAGCARLRAGTEEWLRRGPNKRMTRQRRRE